MTGHGSSQNYNLSSDSKEKSNEEKDKQEWKLHLNQAILDSLGIDLQVNNYLEVDGLVRVQKTRDPEGNKKKNKKMYNRMNPNEEEKKEKEETVLVLEE